MAAVFLISAIFHEYVMILALKFFYPVLFVMFMGAGCKYINRTPNWNLVLFCLIGFFTSHQQSFSYIGTGLPGLNKY